VATANLALIPASALQAVPGCEGGTAPLLIERLAGGGDLNHTLLLHTRIGRFVLRLRRDSRLRPGAEIAREWAVQRLAAEAGLAPRVLAAEAAAGWLLMDYVPAAMWQAQDLLRPDRMAALGRCLATLQALPTPDLPHYDVRAVISSQVAQISAQDAALAGEAHSLQEQAQTLLPAVGARPARLVLCHGDLNTGNILGAQPLLVDWEYAQLANPLHDIACLLSYYPQIQPQADRLLAALGLADPEYRQQLTAQVRLFEIVNALWRLRHGS
jgi:aminoglycoside phosphotransferase (APT) family kinase protein